MTPHLRWRPAPALLLAALLALAAPSALAASANLEAMRVAGSANGSSVETDAPHLDGTGKVIAILSTGVDDEHPALRGAFLTGVDVSAPCPPDPLAPPGGPDVSCYEASDPDDQASFGTFLASAALGRGRSDGTDRGVAPAARLVDVKISQDVSGNGATAGLERGLLWLDAHNRRHPPGDALHVDVALVGTHQLGDAAPEDPAARAALRLAERGDVVLVAPPSRCSLRAPPDCETGEAGVPPLAGHLLVVGPLDDRGTPSREDDTAEPATPSPGPWGLLPNVRAPSANVTTALSGPALFPATGWGASSNALLAPGHVAGVAALLLQDGPTRSPAQVRSAILDSARVMDASGVRQVDAMAALAQARGHSAPAPVAAFSWTPLTPVAGGLVTFDGSASAAGGGPATGHAWRFDNGSTAQGPVATRAFATAGWHAVTLDVHDAWGREASLTRLVEVKAAHREARLALTPDAPRPATLVTADLAGSVGEGPLVLHEVDFGDGALLRCTAEGCEGATDDTQGAWMGPATHRYATPGERVVRLRLVDASGATFGAQATVRVVEDPAAPVAALRLVSSDLTPGATLRFDASGSATPAGLAEARWDFGDGTRWTCPSEACPDALRVDHRYARAGTYDASLALRDAEGREASATLRVVLRDPPPTPTPSAPAGPATTPGPPAEREEPRTGPAPTTTEPASATPAPSGPAATTPARGDEAPAPVAVPPAATTPGPAGAPDAQRPTPGPALPAALIVLALAGLLRRRAQR